MNSRGLTHYFFASFMVLSGLTFQRVFTRAVLPILILSLPVCLRAAEPEQLAGTMPEDYLPDLKPILTQALRRSPELILKEFERLAHEARIYEANAPRLPSLGGNFNYASTASAVSGTSSEQSRGQGLFYSVSLNQNLFHWGALKNQTAIARLNVLITERDTARAYRDIAALLRRNYLSLIAEKARLRQSREAMKLLEQDLQVLIEKKERGTVSSAAVEGERLRLNEQKLELLRAETEFATNRRRFARLAGLTDFSEDAVPNDIPKPSFMEPLATAITAQLLRDNAKSTLEYEIYDLKIRQAVLRQKIENVRLLPKFAANAGYSLRNDTTVNGNAVNQRALTEQTISIGGYWNIFDGLATRGARRAAAVEKRALEQRQALEIEQLLQDVQRLERTLKLDAEQLEFTETRRGMAVQGHQRAAEELVFGNIAKAEVDRARVGILQAQAKNLEARALFLGHWSEFIALTSEDPLLNQLSVRHAREIK